jgi:hypothetical protein
MQTLKRAGQIRRAADLLHDHYAALDEFLSDPAAPDAMSDMLVYFSDASSDEESAHQIARMICEVDAAAEAESSREILAELDDLRRHRPELANAFERAIGSGVIATFLRWDEPAKMFEQLVVRTVTDARREIVIATDAAKRGKAASNRHTARSRKSEPKPVRWWFTPKKNSR